MLIFARIIGLCFVVILLQACDDAAEWNQRMTVEIQTPNGIKSGSSIINVEARVGNLNKFATTSGGGAVTYLIQGEAVVVEVSPERYLFALLAGTEKYQSNPGANAMFAFANMDRFYKNRADGADFPIGEVVDAPRDKPVTLEKDQYPLMVTFTDINDPETIKELNPSDIDIIFGEGYSINKITLEITDSQTTRNKIIELLKWFSDHSGKIKKTSKKYAKDLLPIEKIYKSDFLTSAHSNLLRK